MLLKKLRDQTLVHEYGLDGVRTFPWNGVNAPFGAAYCVVAPGTDSFAHINAPADEDELFVIIAGNATVMLGDEAFPVTSGDQIFIPQGMPHFVRNDSTEPFLFYSVWWNAEGVAGFQARRAAATAPGAAVP
jgi:oxalate decarboxylase/phosphoglucose isomerase-like protein (cupin superfamily)